MIKTVLIDVDNTLLCFYKCAEKALNVAFTKNGIEFKKEYLPYFFSANDRLWRMVEDRVITRQDVYEIRLRSVFSRTRGNRTTSGNQVLYSTFSPFHHCSWSGCGRRWSVSSGDADKLPRPLCSRNNRSACDRHRQDSTYPSLALLCHMPIDILHCCLSDHFAF